MPTDAPRFSVLIPAYNASATLSETVDSVLAQSFTDFEVVIVDDGSTDVTAEIADGYAAGDPRIVVVRQGNRGTAGAYNTAARHARAGLLVMLSADDLLLPTHLESVNGLVSESPDASIFSTDGYYLFDDGTTKRVRPNADWQERGTCALTDLVERCFYSVGAVFTRDVFDSVGGFSEGMYAEDYLFWLLAMARGFTHRYLDEPLSVHRVTDAAKSASHLAMRLNDVATLRELVVSGLLTDAQVAIAEERIARLERNVRIRHTLGSVLGTAGAERMIAWIRRGQGARGGRL